MDIVEEDNTNCPICCSDYTTKVRKLVHCSGCKKNICLICTKKYLLSISVSPHCMHCKREFSADWIDNVFSKNFRENELRKHRITLLMEQEKSMFPHTLEQMEKDELMNRSTQLINDQKIILDSISPRDLKMVSYNTLLELNNKKEELKTILERLKSLTVINNEKKEHKIARKCPDCNDGYLDSAYKCLHCQKSICRTCFCIKASQDHVCKEEDIATYKLLIHETKPCPKCSCRIQKTQGCNQMWCTNCNTAFDWNNLTIITGRIHNPHYQEYLNKNQITNNFEWRDNCENNNEPFTFPYDNSYVVFRTIRQGLAIGNNPLPFDERGLNVKLSQIIGCINQRAHNGLQKTVLYTTNLYENLRKQYLRKELTEKRWFSILSTKETIRERERKFGQLDELLVNIARDLFRIVLNSVSNYLTLYDLEKNLLLPMDKARIYYNEQYQRLCKEYQIHNCNEFLRFHKTVHLNSEWYFSDKEEIPPPMYPLPKSSDLSNLN